MPNGNNNNGNDDIELLPPELRRPEEKKKKEEKPEVKLFIPEIEEKSPKPTFVGRFFSSKQSSKPLTPPKQTVTPSAESDLSVFKMQKEAPRPAPIFPPAPPRPIPPPGPKPFSPPPKSNIEQKPPQAPQKVEMKRPQNVALPPKTNLSKPSGGKIPTDKKTDITLIPAEESSAKEKRKTSRKAIFLIIAAVVLALIGGGAYWAIKFYQEQVDSDLRKVEAELEIMDKKNQELAPGKDQAQFFQKQLKTANKLLGNHIYWTNFFSFLEKNTVADVYFVNLIGGSDGQVVMSGVAKSYAAMARQITAFRDEPRVSKVSVLSASASVDPEGNVAEINFDAKLQLNPEIFLK